jgi:competence protein ComEA
MVDINSASTTELKALPGVTDTDATKIVQGRPYADKSQLLSKKVVSEPTYEKIKDHVVARQSKS